MYTLYFDNGTLFHDTKVNDLVTLTMAFVLKLFISDFLFMESQWGQNSNIATM